MAYKGERKWRANWLIVAFGLTFAYACVLGFVLLPATASCTDHLDASLWQKYLACRPANELGDFLSGAFAPVALLWLVAAVLIQAQELRAQREELALTRQELAASREVMKEQAEQARMQAIQAQRQADFIGEQTENLKRQAEDYYREKQDRIFDEALQALHKNVVSPLGRASFKVPTAAAGTTVGSFSDYRNMEPDKAVHQMRGELQSLSASLAHLHPNQEPVIPIASIKALPDALEKFIAMKDRLSLAHQIKFDSLGLAESHAYAKSIIDMLKEPTAEKHN
ncbi:hypothetical protein GFL88_19345 [Rhizobium leguminosarum bv. viciae]|uniref:hypothetical protein n=1 Tax=Rhizobium leguminosarum TaxID=384 RepID=UPI001441855B|nr:hypothetical protein [Rhizobium leguminosarum]NKK65646.1 hypothetical protein [Rhizobium leguminosarum bv. viciae]